MKNRLISVTHYLLLVLPAAGVLLSAGIVSGQTDTTFTYQGLLTQNGSPVTTPCNLRFRLFDAATGGTQIGISQTINNVTFSEGRFTVQIDFGVNAFDNSSRWLDILYQCPAGVGSFIILSPRQPVTRSPYAIQTRGIFVDADNDVGIKTDVVEAHLHVNGAGSNDTGLLIEAPGAATGEILFTSPNGHVGMVAFANNGNRRDIRFQQNGIGLFTSNSPEAPATGHGLFVDEDGGVQIKGDLTLGTGSRTITPILEITGGSDFSEMFDVGGDAKPQPGTVVVIDPDNPGRLIPSTSAYDRKVAGIISGAGGVATGMTMGHVGTIADGEHPVALSGRVYCLVDASDAAVEPGDLLTTSSTPGHAMKANDAESVNGAIIGKAMSGLAKGEIGLVLVLVNLQ